MYHELGWQLVFGGCGLLVVVAGGFMYLLIRR